MKMRLRILHGKLQDKQGHEASAYVAIRGPRFLIGSAADCAMCCKSSTVSAHHCEVRLEADRAVLSVLCSDNDTYVNGQPVIRERVLQPGDHLRIGRLEFEVIIDAPAPAGERASGEQASGEQASGEQASGEQASGEQAGREQDAQPQLREDADPEKLEQLLEEADERARAFRREHPELRYLHLDALEADVSHSAVEPADEGKDTKKKKKKRPAEPGKLPPPPPAATEDSTEAAEQALRKLFSR